MSEEKHIFTKGNFYNLLKDGHQFNLTQAVPQLCIDYIESVGEAIKRSVFEETRKQSRTTILQRDIEKVLTEFRIDYSIPYEDAYIPKAHIHRLLEDAEKKIKISSDAVEILANGIEKHIHEIGDLAEITITQLGKKTVDEDTIKRVFQSFSGKNNIPYADFLEAIYSAEELRQICEAEQLHKNGTKGELVNRLHSRNVPLQRVLNRIPFSDIQSRIIKTEMPVPRVFQDLFAWIEAPKIILPIEIEPKGTIDVSPSSDPAKLEMNQEKKQDKLESNQNSAENSSSISTVVSNSSEIPSLITNPENEQATINSQNSDNIMIEETSKQEMTEELQLLEKIVDYSQFITKEKDKIILKSVLTELLSYPALKKINQDGDANLNPADFPEKDAMIAALMKSGISVTYYLLQLSTTHLKGLLRALNLKMTGNKIDLIHRIINTVSFLDYDITHEDSILLLQGKEFVLKRQAEKQKEDFFKSKIRNYSGSIKLEILQILEKFNFRLTEEKLKDEYKKDGRDPISFFGIIGGILRDGILTIDPLKQEYFVSEELKSIVATTLIEIREKTKQLESLVQDLPSSSALMLSFICSYGDVTNLKDVKDKFTQIYRANQTWNKARQILKERHLITEKYDEEREQTVVYSERQICPILSGLLTKKKTEILEAEQKIQSEETIRSEKVIEIDLSILTNNAKRLLYILIVSGGNIEKNMLGQLVTKESYQQMADTTYIRTLKQLRETNLITEEKDPESKLKILSVLDSNLDDLRTKLEPEIFDLNITKLFDEYSRSILAIVKFIADEGGLIEKQALRKNFLNYYSANVFYAGLKRLQESILIEGISSDGDLKYGVPNMFLKEIQEYFIRNPLQLTEKQAAKLTAEDFLLNNCEVNKLYQIANCYALQANLDDHTIIKQLLYEKNLPLIALAAEIIPKQEMSKFCKENQLAFTGAKSDLMKRIVMILSIDETIIIQGELKKVIPPKEQSSKLENACTSDIDPTKDLYEEVTRSGIDKELLFETLDKKVDKSKLKEYAKKLNVKISGSKESLLNEIFFQSDVTYEEIIKELASVELLEDLKRETNNSNLNTTSLIEQISNSPSFPVKNRIFELKEFLEVLSKFDLRNVVKNLNGRISGNRESLLEQIINYSSSNFEETIIMILRIAPDWITSIEQKFNIIIDKSNAQKSLLKLLNIGGKSPAAKEKVQTKLKIEPKENHPSNAEGVDQTKNSKSTLSEKTAPKGSPSKSKQSFEHTIDGLRALIKHNFAVEEYQDGLEEVNIPNLDEMNAENAYDFFNAPGRSFLKKLIQVGEMAIDLSVNPSSDTIIQEIFEIYNISFRVSNLTLTEKVARLLLEKRTILASGLTAFSQGNIKSAIESLKYENQEIGKKFQSELSAKDMANPSLQGVIFEASVYHALNSLSTKEEIHGMKKIIPTAIFNNFQDKAEGADGIIQVRLVRDESHDYYCLYDCKAYKDSYPMQQGFLKFMDYLKLEDEKTKKLNRPQEWRYFIVFSNKFQVDLKVLEDKLLRNKEYSKYTLILWEAKALRKMWSENRNNDMELAAHINWEKIFSLDKHIVYVDEKFTDNLLKDAEKERETDKF